MNKQYKAIFFDWDGTAVTSRKAPADKAVLEMKKLLSKGIQLIIVSGTTYDNIAGGKLEEYFTEAELKNLYLGLGRGAYNYRFTGKAPIIFQHRIPDKQTLLKIHDICYEIHRTLLEQYDFQTDIVFCRPNYCKIDIMVGNDRGDALFMQEDELTVLKKSLAAHGIPDGLQSLLTLSANIGEKHGLKVSATCDAKYLEVGISDKSDNVNTILGELGNKLSISAQDCCFWGDEFVGIEPGIFGSDSFMRTDETKSGDFFDVSEVKGERPNGVSIIGGGVGRFLEFLQEQAVL